MFEPKTVKIWHMIYSEILFCIEWVFQCVWSRVLLAACGGKSQIEPTRALANRRKPRGSGISHGSRYARPSGSTWLNLRPLEIGNGPAGLLEIVWKK